MKIWWKVLGTCLLFAVVLVGFRAQEATSASRDDSEHDSEEQEALARVDRRIDSNARRMVREGRQIFRFDTFGDEAFWGDLLGLHKAIEGTAFGGVATPDLKIDGVSPKTALAVGLKVDVEALPEISSTP